MFRSTIGYESNLDGVERTEIANGWGEGGGEELHIACIEISILFERFNNFILAAIHNWNNHILSRYRSNMAGPFDTKQYRRLHFVPSYLFPAITVFVLRSNSPEIRIAY